MEEGGLDALMLLLRSSKNITILRVASGAIANLAMNGNTASSIFPGLFHCIVNFDQKVTMMVQLFQNKLATNLKCSLFYL